jgi:hypothetical protein
LEAEVLRLSDVAREGAGRDAAAKAIMFGYDVIVFWFTFVISHLHSHSHPFSHARSYLQGVVAELQRAGEAAAQKAARQVHHTTPVRCLVDPALPCTTASYVGVSCAPFPAVMPSSLVTLWQ